MHAPLSHRCTVLVALVALCSCGSGEPDAPGARPRRPDVLMLLVDTLRADRLGCYGYTRPTSPNLDALAARGTVFRHCSAQAPWTIPSVSSIVTGTYPTSHQEHPAPEHPTIAELFQRAGYRTLGVCSNFVILPEVGFGRGFDEFIPRSYVDEKGRRRKRQGGDFDEVIEWLDEALQRAVAAPEGGGERPPLFLYVHPVDPHAPYVKLQRYAEVLPANGAPPILPEGWMQEQLAALGPPPPEDDPGWANALGEIHVERSLYDREVRSTDEMFARLMARLQELGVGDHLVVALLSDHGEELWEHLSPMTAEARKANPPITLFYQSHGYILSEQALHTPLVLAGPGVPAGRVVDAPVENVDLMPTLLELCDVPIDFEPHGESLLALARGDVPREDWRPATFAYVEQGMTVREHTTGLKLVLPTARGHELGFAPELYDLRQDPYEHANVFDQRPEDVQRLTGLLQDYLQRYPSTEQTVTGREAEDLLDLLNEFGYGGDMIRAGKDADGGR